jgi:hypothetical protein
MLATHILRRHQVADDPLVGRTDAVALHILLPQVFHAAPLSASLWGKAKIDYRLKHMPLYPILAACQIAGRELCPEGQHVCQFGANLTGNGTMVE